MKNKQNTFLLKKRAKHFYPSSKENSPPNTFSVINKFKLS